MPPATAVRPRASSVMTSAVPSNRPNAASASAATVIALTECCAVRWAWAHAQAVAAATSWDRAWGRASNACRHNLVVIERDIRLPNGRTLHVYDTGTDHDGRLPIIWHHGTPNIGAPPEPL